MHARKESDVIKKVEGRALALRLLARRGELFGKPCAKCRKGIEVVCDGIPERTSERTPARAARASASAGVLFQKQVRCAWVSASGAAGAGSSKERCFFLTVLANESGTEVIGFPCPALPARASKFLGKRNESLG